MKKMGLALIIVGVLLAGTGVYMMTSDNNTNITSGREINIKTSQDNRTKDIASGTFENNQTSVSAGMESDTEPQKIEKENENGSTPVKSDPKEIGNAFENFVANLFADRSTFTVLEWNQGTTSTEGVYAEHDKNPDFRINQSFKKNGLEYWVECKYRTPDSNNQVTIK